MKIEWPRKSQRGGGDKGDTSAGRLTKREMYIERTFFASNASQTNFHCDELKTSKREKGQVESKICRGLSKIWVIGNCYFRQL